VLLKSCCCHNLAASHGQRCAELLSLAVRKLRCWPTTWQNQRHMQLTDVEGVQQPHPTGHELNKAA
jgi:hypothetical protein